MIACILNFIQIQLLRSNSISKIGYSKVVGKNSESQIEIVKIITKK